MFDSKSNKGGNQKLKPRTMERNVIAKNSTFVGEITSDGDFRIDGILEGTLKTAGKVIIGVDGFVKGTIEASNAEIEGKFSGQLSIANTLTLNATANISGDVTVGKLSVEVGVTFNATCVMKGALKELNKSNETKQASGKTA
jgi:cytoskeletal protein CcmA (bactofilin family)